jgi:hypothetical protein
VERVWVVQVKKRSVRILGGLEMGEGGGEEGRMGLTGRLERVRRLRLRRRSGR